MTRLRIPALLALALIAPAVVLADDPPKPTPPIKVDDPLKPIPPVAIPDDPPPHEGAMIDIPLVIEPPDIIIVEVLEALPGRPITGEHLVRPDGMISLGFYGDVHVRGLTLRQAKAKILLQLRRFVLDQTLGLVLHKSLAAPLEPLPKPGTIVPPQQRPVIELEPDMKHEPAPNKPEAKPSVSTSRRRRARVDGRRPRRTRVALQNEGEPLKVPQDPKVPLPAEEPIKGDEQPNHEEDFVVVNPEDSTRIFVDISSHNTRAYYVQGDVGVPGRLPSTGKETVLDALNYAGGLLAIAEPTEIHLYRPARGNKPTKDYRIDLAAIQKGDKTANLQIFPDDRLFVGRNPIVKKTTEIDRAA